jgi:hypothetical protein
MKKRYIFLIILALLVGGGLLLYHNTFGFGAKKKYENCVKACQKVIILEADLPACQIRCEEITDYSPKNEGATQTKKPTATSKSTPTPQAKATPVPGEQVYACEWSWPQKVIDKNTKKVVKVCPSARPWCHSTDLTKDGAGCCGNVNEATLDYFDCKTLSEL